MNDCISQQPQYRSSMLHFEGSHVETRFIRDEEGRATISRESPGYERWSFSLTTWIDCRAHHPHVVRLGQILNFADPCFFLSVKYIQ